MVSPVAYLTFDFSIYFFVSFINLQVFVCFFSATIVDDKNVSLRTSQKRASNFLFLNLASLFFKPCLMDSATKRFFLDTVIFQRRSWLQPFTLGQHEGAYQNSGNAFTERSSSKCHQYGRWYAVTFGCSQWAQGNRRNSKSLFYQTFSLPNRHFRHG